MKKRHTFICSIIAAVTMAAFSVTAYGSDRSAEYDGCWKQSDSNGQTWQGGFIDGNLIEIYWISDGGNEAALYWSGSFEAPEDDTDSFTWISVNNTERTSHSLLASQAEQKEFTFADGEISYEATALGVTKTVKLVPTDDDYLKWKPSDTGTSEAPARTETPDADEIADQVEIRYEPTLDGKLCVFITNNSTSVIDELGIQALYKDADGVTIDTDKDGHDMVLPGYTVVSQLSAPEEYDFVDIKKDIELGVHPNYVNHSEDVTVDAHDGSDGIIIEITNNGSEDIEEVEYAVVYYLGDEIASAGYARDIYDLKAGDTATESEKPYGIGYDRYEVYLNQAHTFGI